MTVKEMRAMTGLSQSQFAAKFNIPTGTFQAWEQGRQNPPAYVTSMMEKILLMAQPAEGFNPFYDSEFLVAHSGEQESRMLIELHTDELLQLRAEINAVLERRPTNECKC